MLAVLPSLLTLFVDQLSSFAKGRDHLTLPLALGDWIDSLCDLLAHNERRIARASAKEMFFSGPRPISLRRPFD